MRLILRLAIACAFAVTSDATARPLSVDDLLRFEQWGQIAIAPKGRWLIIEKRGAYDGAPSFEGDYYTRFTVSRLYVVDLNRPAPARLLMPQAAGSGYVAGPISPDGAAMVVYRLQGRRWQAGVVDLPTGSARWLNGTPQLASLGRAAQWRSNTELLLISRSDEELPARMRIGWNAMAQLPSLWRQTSRGAVAVTEIGSGRFRGLTPSPAVYDLVQVDTRSGREKVLASGPFVDLELSASGRFAAVVRAEDHIEPAAVKALRDGSTLQRHGVSVIDLETGAVVEPCADWDVLTQLLSWSPLVDELLIFARASEATSWPNARLMRIDARTSRVTPLDRAELSPAVEIAREGSVTVRANWLGPDPIIYGRSAGASRNDWYALRPSGHLNLTKDLPVIPPSPSALTRASILFVGENKAWRVDRSGRARALGGAWSFTAQVASPLDAGARIFLNHPPRRSWAAARVGRPGRAGLARLGGAEVEVQRVPEGARIVAFDDRTVVTVEQDGRGVANLGVRTGNRPAVQILTLNPDLADIDFAQVRRIRGAGPDGRELSHWMYLPPYWRGAQRLPLVVIPYPGATYPHAPAKYAPGASTFYTNPQLLAANGYAVLVPSLPRGAKDEPMSGIAEQIEAAVDLAIAEGYADPERLAVWGHSYGGYAALASATESARFGAVISSAGISDLINHWGSIPPGHAVAPDLGPAINWGAGWVEGGAALGGPPWAAPQAYYRNSPLMFADRITAPILLIQGDQDEVSLGQAQAMFSALYRQGKDAVLLTYWGESHVVNSPGNVRDLYARVLAWLDETLAPSAAEKTSSIGGASPAAPTSGDRSNDPDHVKQLEHAGPEAHPSGR
jgi:dipeptidyl aminopeptidase/acylaminoacyl peptidase